MMAKESPQERAARLKAARAEQERAARKRNALMVAAVVLVMAAIVGGGYAISKMTNSTPKDTAVAAAAGSVSIGPTSAPNHVVIYEDFLCPYCGALENASRTQLAALAEQGKIRVTYRPFNLLQTDYSRQTSEIFQVLVRNSSAEVTKKFHDLLFENQPAEQGPFPSKDELIDLAVQAGAVRADVEVGLSRSASQWANEADAGADQAGVRSTPTVLLNGTDFTSGSTVDDLVNGLIKAVS